MCDTVNDDDEPGTPGGGAGAGVAGAGRQSVASRDSAASASSSATFVMDGQRWDFFLVITAGIAGGCRPCLVWLYCALVMGAAAAGAAEAGAGEEGGLQQAHTKREGRKKGRGISPSAR